MIKNLSLAILFVMVLFACNDGTDDEDYYSSSHEVPCLDVYESYLQDLQTLMIGGAIQYQYQFPYLRPFQCQIQQRVPLRL